MPFAYSASLTSILALVALLLASCVSLDQPQGWSANSEKLLPNGCPDISGTYATRAAEVYPANAGILPPLNEILGPGGLSDMYKRDRPWPALPGATTAALTLDGDWLYVHFRDDAGGVADLKFKRKHWWGGSIDGADGMYHCQKLEQNAALRIDGSRRPSFAVPHLFQPSDVPLLFLSKDRDGSLIVNYRTLRAFVPVPQIGLPVIDWRVGIGWRYPAVAPNP